MQSHAEAVTEAGEADATVGLYQDVTCLDVTAQSIAWHHISFNCHLYVHFQFKQEGQHPLTGQRAANFRLLANQWAERRLVTQWRHGCRAMWRSVCNAGASNGGRSLCVQISRELPPANILTRLERQLIALQLCLWQCLYNETSQQTSRPLLSKLSQRRQI